MNEDRISPFLARLWLSHNNHAIYSRNAMLSLLIRCLALFYISVKNGRSNALSVPICEQGKWAYALLKLFLLKITAT